jgi:hypothetical protein
LSARGTSTLLNNVLLSAHFRLADDPGVDRLFLLLAGIANSSTAIPSFFEKGDYHEETAWVEIR